MICLDNRASDVDCRKPTLSATQPGFESRSLATAKGLCPAALQRVKSARAGESLAFEKNKKAASPENCTGLAAFFEEPTYLDHVNARTRSRFQYRPETV